MARIRSIKPEFWTDEKVVMLSDTAKCLFIGIWNFCDDEGRMEFSPIRIKLQVLPLNPSDLSGEIGELQGSGVITIYEVGGKKYLEVNNFNKHQKIDKRSASKIPANSTNPPEPPRITSNPPDGREGKGEVVGKEKQQQESKKDKTSLPPLSVPRLPEQKAIKNIDFDAAAAACCSVLSKRMLPPSDGALLLGWLEHYDFQGFIFPIIAESATKYANKNNGQKPASLSYFIDRIRERSGRTN